MSMFRTPAYLVMPFKKKKMGNWTHNYLPLKKEKHEWFCSTFLDLLTTLIKSMKYFIVTFSQFYSQTPNPHIYLLYGHLIHTCAYVCMYAQYSL